MGNICSITVNLATDPEEVRILEKCDLGEINISSSRFVPQDGYIACMDKHEVVWTRTSHWNSSLLEDDLWRSVDIPGEEAVSACCKRYKQTRSIYSV